MEAVISIVVSPIVQKIIDQASAFAQEKYRLLRGLEEQVRKISSNLSAIKATFEEAEKRQVDSPQTKDWLDKHKEVLQDIEDTLETFETQASLWERKRKVRKNFCLPHLSATETSFRSDIAQRIEKHLQDIENIKNERKSFHFNAESQSGNISTNVDNESSSNSIIVHECDVVGREKDKNDIIYLLSSGKFDREGSSSSISVVPIIGMAGMGKTTLAQLVYKDNKVKKHFEFMMWVCVTFNFNYTKILRDMLKNDPKISLDLNSLSSLQLENILLEVLSEKYFLLVLDDVWPDTFEWEQLEKLLKSGKKGCSVLITSRSETVGTNVMGIRRQPYTLGKLPEEKCWSLFEKIAFDQNNEVGSERGELEKIGKEIVSKCDGLPLAIRVIGSLLTGNHDVKKWRSILKNKIWNVEKNSDTGKQKLFPALMLSYNHLPSHLKRCFAFCCIYPKAYVFRKTELVKVWKAASLIVPREDASIDDIGREYFDRLKSRSFFQLSQSDAEETFRMHDLFHDLAISISSPYFPQVKDNSNGPSCNFSEKVRHVSLLLGNDAQPPLEHVTKSCTKLRTLVSPTEHVKNFDSQALEMLFSTLKYIRILDLSSSMIQELPDSVSKLKLLHYLDLSGTKITRLPDSVCNLINLLTFKMLQCPWLFELPQRLGNLTNLQHLELDDMFWYKLRKLPPRMGRITGLQNLHAFHVLNESGYRIDELKGMKHLKGALHIKKLENAVNAGEAKLKDKEDLEKVVFEWSTTREQDGASDERVLENLQPHSKVKEVQVINYLGIQFPPWMRKGLAENLVSLSLNHCRKCKVLSLGGFPRLQKLYIKGLLELKEWVDAPYKNLQWLTISNCPMLEDLPQCFEKLWVMKIKKCNSLKALPSAPSLGFLVLIDNLVLKDFNKSFSNLLGLKLMNCPKLAKLPDILQPQKLEVSGCPLLATLPTPRISRRLQHLAIDACDDGRLMAAIPESSSLYSLVISNISGISSFPKWQLLPGLKALYISGCKDLVSLSTEEVAFEGLDSLELLSIRDCPKLKMLPDKGLPKELKCLIISSCPSLKSLGHKELLKSLICLKDLYIENCPELEMLPEDGFSTTLEHLQIEGCPKLSKQCRKGSGQDWPKIMHIPDLEVTSSQDPTQKYPSRAWFHRFICCEGTGTEMELTTSD